MLVLKSSKNKKEDCENQLDNLALSEVCKMYSCIVPQGALFHISRIARRRSKKAVCHNIFKILLSILVTLQLSYDL